MEEAGDGEGGDDGLQALDLLNKKAEEVLSAFELLPAHLQMDGLDVLQGIVTKTVRKITLGKVASVKFVPVQQKRTAAQVTVAAPTASEQEVTTSNQDVRADTDTTAAEPVALHEDVVHFDDDEPARPKSERVEEDDSLVQAAAAATSSCSPDNYSTLLDPGDQPSNRTPDESNTPHSDLGGESARGSAPGSGERTERQCRSMERKAARAAIAKIHKEVVSDLNNPLGSPTSLGMLDLSTDIDSNWEDNDAGGATDSDEAEMDNDGSESEGTINNRPTRPKRRRAINRNEESTRKAFRCRYCPYSSDTKLELQSHHTTIHSGNRIYECEYCQKQFSAVSSLKRHKMRHTGEKPYECPVCGKRFFVEADLKTHSVVHTGERMYQCSECPKTYTCSANLRRHVRIHTGEMPYACGECDARFRDFSSLKLHKLKHTGEKPFSCEVCSKQFKTSSDFRRHERTHTGERNYQCRDCGKTFIQGWHLVQHRRMHTNERAWGCETCGKRMRTKASLQFHLRSHAGIKNYTCSTCKKSFSTKKYLQSHQVLHTLSKPFKCSVCPAQFNQYPNMKRHERIHSDERRYKCKLCPKQFKYINSLQYHEAAHRGHLLMCDKCGLGFRCKVSIDHHRCNPSRYHQNIRKTVNKQRVEVRLERLELSSVDGSVGVFKVHTMGLSTVKPTGGKEEEKKEKPPAVRLPELIDLSMEDTPEEEGAMVASQGTRVEQEHGSPQQEQQPEQQQPEQQQHQQQQQQQHHQQQHQQPRIVLKIPKQKLKRSKTPTKPAAAAELPAQSNEPMAHIEDVKTTTTEDEEPPELEEIPKLDSLPIVEHSSMPTLMKSRRADCRSRKAKIPEREKRVPPLKISRASCSPEAGRGSSVAVPVFPRDNIPEGSDSAQLLLFDEVKSEVDSDVEPEAEVSPVAPSSNSRSKASPKRKKTRQTKTKRSPPETTAKQAPTGKSANKQVTSVSLGLTVLKNTAGEVIVKEEFLLDQSIEMSAMEEAGQAISDMDEPLPMVADNTDSTSTPSDAPSDMELMKAAYTCT